MFLSSVFLSCFFFCFFLARCQMRNLGTMLPKLNLVQNTKLRLIHVSFLLSFYLTLFFCGLFFQYHTCPAQNLPVSKFHARRTILLKILKMVMRDGGLIQILFIFLPNGDD